MTSRGRGVTRAEGHKQVVISEAARIVGRGLQAEAGGHKSRGRESRRSRARVRKRRSRAGMHEREADKVMAESYKQRQGGSQEQRVTSKES